MRRTAGMRRRHSRHRGPDEELRRFPGAVSDVSLRVKRGAIHALIGPNGAGKTTCFNMLTKFIAPTAGTIIFNSRDITAMRPADVARLGLVRSFQISAVFPASDRAGERPHRAAAQARGNSFDFWRSKKVLEAAQRAGAASCSTTSG